MDKEELYKISHWSEILSTIGMYLKELDNGCANVNYNTGSMIMDYSDKINSAVGEFADQYSSEIIDFREDKIKRELFSLNQIPDGNSKLDRVVNLISTIQEAADKATEANGYLHGIISGLDKEKIRLQTSC